MLDCGIHPGLSGMDALPFVDMIPADQVNKIDQINLKIRMNYLNCGLELVLYKRSRGLK